MLGFKGRLRRGPFMAWMAGVLLTGPIALLVFQPAIGLIARAPSRDQAMLIANSLTLLVCLIALALIWITLAAMVRRLHDMGWRPVLSLLGLVAVSVFDVFLIAPHMPQFQTLFGPVGDTAPISSMAVEFGWLTLLAVWPPRPPTAAEQADHWTNRAHDALTATPAPVSTSPVSGGFGRR